MLFYKKTHIGVDSNTEPPQVDANDLSTRLYSQIFFQKHICLHKIIFKKNNKKKFFNYFCCPRRCTYTILGGFYYIYIYMYSSTQYIIPDPNICSTQYIIPNPNIYSTLLVFGTTHVQSAWYNTGYSTDSILKTVL